MHRNRVRWTLAVVLFLCAAVAMAKSNVPTANTHAAIKAYVHSAAKYVAKHGPSCDTFKTKDWMSGDYYVIVTGPAEAVVCHPSESLVGKPVSEIVDKNGKKVGADILIESHRKGGGWVDYMWPRPGETEPVKKSTYSMRVKAPDGKWYTVAAGGYELK